ncbi:TPA: hypothetical protein N0F65_000399 [Lagenidium giganteum]|uniref:Lipid-A-disaccharide synthase n=1 Tax=Lagenidium giganteum TaxID=4803 RepID=A0AAV2Z419_9STRA|nr:TPA: hypothetical protein N0F65_000399 [Lagenidium giganteum]
MLTTMAVNTKQLPAKENALFRSIVKYYEIKQYKKGLKAADSILKKYPDHGETLAMKGLTLSCMNKKEEAYEYVRLGLKNDLKSHVCWHVYGLLYRADRNYNEAIKCYRNAIRIDPENLQILRDLYLLQVQMRDLKGFAETRRTMLTLKPNNRNNWIGFAIAHHLVGNYQMAIDIIDKYFSTLDTTRAANYEDSEIFMYQNQLVEESGDLERALSHLEESKAMILDTLWWRQKKAELLLRLGRYTESIAVFEELLEVNFDNYNYHRGVQCAVMERKDLFQPNNKALPSATVDFSKESKGKEMAEALCKFYDSKMDTVNAKSKSVTCLRLPLDFTTGEDFRKRADALMKKQLTAGVPSLGSDLKSIYLSASKAKIVEELTLSYLKTLEAKKPLVGTAAPSPTVLLWTMYFAAQHYDRLGNHAKAIEFIDKCIKHTPTVLDFYQRKARILKHMGELNKAADVMVEGRLLDLADRYINNKATEYLLHADRVEDADATIALFARHEGDPQQNLFDMQCMWYENECGKSYLRQKNYGLALKRFCAVEKHFADFIEDQFDFHTYCIRKMTLRSYIQMLRMCDTIYSHAAFVDAAHGAIATYLELSDKATAAAANGGDGGSKQSAAEKKKAKRAQAKARKAEFRKQEEEAEKAKQKEAEDANKAKKAGLPPRANKDTDPLGEELVNKPHLEEAWRFAKILQDYVGSDIKTHLASFDVALRKNKVLLCLQALLRAQKCLEAGVPARDADKLKKEVATRRTRFLEEAKKVTDPTVAMVLYVIAGEASGDAIGAKVLAALARKKAAGDVRVQELHVQGIGGPLMRAAVPFDSLFPMHDLSVMGLVEVLPALWRFRRRLKETVADIRAFQPDVVLTIDSKGFTFRVLKALQRDAATSSGILRMHYVAPSVWAYTHKRGKRPEDYAGLAQLLEHMFVLMPFEPTIFQATKERRWCTFVGHPAVEDALEMHGRFDDHTCERVESGKTPHEITVGHDALLRLHEDPLSCLSHGDMFQAWMKEARSAVDKERVRRELGIASNARVICALVGSRENEVKKTLSTVIEAIHEVQRQHSHTELHLVFPTTSALASVVRSAVAQQPFVSSVLVDLSAPERFELFVASDGAVAVSGTIVTETTLAGVPTTVIYRANRLTEIIAQRLAAVRFVSLPNLLLGREVIPELLFSNCTATNIAHALMRTLHTESNAEQATRNADVALASLSALASWEPSQRGPKPVRASDIVAETILQAVARKKAQ